MTQFKFIVELNDFLLVPNRAKASAQIWDRTHHCRFEDDVLYINIGYLHTLVLGFPDKWHNPEFQCHLVTSNSLHI